jgi:hypothetical protein
MLVFDENTQVGKIDMGYYDNLIQDYLKRNPDSTYMELELIRSQKMYIRFPMTANDIIDMNSRIKDHMKNDGSYRVSFMTLKNTNISKDIDGRVGDNSPITEILLAMEDLAQFTGVQYSLYAQKNDIIGKIIMICLSEISCYCADFYYSSDSDGAYMGGVDANIPSEEDIKDVCLQIINYANLSKIQAVKKAIALLIAGAGKSCIALNASIRRSLYEAYPDDNCMMRSNPSTMYDMSRTRENQQSPLLSMYVPLIAKKLMFDFAINELFDGVIPNSLGTFTILNKGVQTTADTSSDNQKWWNKDGAIANGLDSSGVFTWLCLSDRGEAQCTMFSTYVKLQTLAMAYQNYSDANSFKIANPLIMLNGNGETESEVFKFMESSVASKPEYLTEDKDFGGYSKSKIALNLYPYSGTGMGNRTYQAATNLLLSLSGKQYNVLRFGYKENDDIKKLCESSDSIRHFIDFACSLFSNEAVRIAFITHHMPWFFLSKILDDENLIEAMFDKVASNIPEMELLAFKEMICTPINDTDAFCFDGDKENDPYDPSTKFDKLFSVVEKHLPNMANTDENALITAKFILCMSDTEIRQTRKWSILRAKMFGLFCDHYELFDKVADKFFDCNYVKDETIEIRKLAFIEYAMSQTFFMGRTARFIYGITGGTDSTAVSIKKAAESFRNGNVDHSIPWFQYRTDKTARANPMGIDKEGHPFSANMLYCLAITSPFQYAMIPADSRNDQDVFSNHNIGCIKSDLLRKDILYLSLLEGISSLMTYVSTSRQDIANCKNLTNEDISDVLKDTYYFEILKRIESWRMIKLITSKLCNICFKSTKRFFYRILYTMKTIVYSFNTIIIRQSDVGIVPADDPLGTMDGIKIKSASEFIEAVSTSFLSKEAKAYLMSPYDMAKLTSIKDYCWTTDEEEDIKYLRIIMDIPTGSIYDNLDWCHSRFFFGLGIVAAMAAIDGSKNCPVEISNEYLTRYLKKGED